MSLLSNRKARKQLAAQTLTVSELERVVVSLLNMNVVERIACVIFGPRVVLRWKAQGDL